MVEVPATVFTLPNIGRSRYTAIAFDQARQHVLLDRTKSGSAVDEDLRAGPWPGTMRL